jgi:hypothetical protein
VSVFTAPPESSSFRRLSYQAKLRTAEGGALCMYKKETARLFKAWSLTYRCRHPVKGRVPSAYSHSNAASHSRLRSHLATLNRAIERRPSR